MTEPPPDPIDILADLEARIEELKAAERPGHADTLPRFRAELATPSVVQALLRELSRETPRVRASGAVVDLARLSRLHDVAATLGMMAFIAKLPIAEDFMAITRATLEVIGPNDELDRVTGFMDANGNQYELPTRPGPFTVGGPGCDVVVAGLVGVQAIGERLPNGQVRITDPRAKPVAERNAPCPCGSGRKFKRCCAN